MANNATHRRTLASSQPQPSSSMDPTLNKKKTTTKSISNPHQLIPSKPNFYMSNPLAKLNPSHKSRPQPPPVYVDTHLQAKAISVSADFESSCRVSFIKSKHRQQLKRIESRVEKESIKEAAAEASKEKVKRVASDVDEKKVEKFINSNNKNGSGKEGNDLIEGLDIKGMTFSLNGVGGGRRRSLCGSQINLADFLANNGAKIVSVDMPPFMQIHAVDCARKTHDSLEKFTSKTLALTLKKEFDGVYGPAWHCIVGKSFGSFVTHSVGGFLYFSMDQKLYVLLFKTTVQRAL